MQKMMFLFEQEEKSNDFQFQAANYGPFSWRLSSALDSLVAGGLINETRTYFQNGAEKYEYSLTPSGVGEVREHLQEDAQYGRYLKVMEAIKERYNGMSLGLLLRLIYSKYPDYAVKSQYEF